MCKEAPDEKLKINELGPNQGVDCRLLLLCEHMPPPLSPLTHTHIQDDQGIYRDKVREMVRSHSHRLIVNINDLRRKNATRATK